MFILFFDFNNNYRYYVLSEQGQILEYNDFLNFDYYLSDKIKKYKLFFGGILSDNKELILKCDEYCNKFFNIKIITIVDEKIKSDYFLYQDLIFNELQLKYKNEDLIYIDLSKDLSVYKIQDNKLNYSLVASLSLLKKNIDELGHFPFAITFSNYLKIIIKGLCFDFDDIIIFGMNSNDFFDKEMFFDFIKINFVEKDLLINASIKKLKEKISF